MNEQLTQRRIKALENLVNVYLENDRRSGHKEFRGPLSMSNSFRIEFDKPAVQSDLEELIKILQTYLPLLPKSRDDRTLDEIITDAIKEASIPLTGN